MRLAKHAIFLLAGLVLSQLALSNSWAEEKKTEEKSVKIELADGKIQLDAPKSWEKKEPRVRIIDFEFAIEPVEGDKNPGRMTVMGAGGSIEANIDRWVGQFTKPEKKPVDKKTIADQTVYIVDISGTFSDRRGPFAPATKYDDYRMLAAIIKTEKLGQYFLKFYGPEKTVAENEKAFKAMVESLKVK